MRRLIRLVRSIVSLWLMQLAVTVAPENEKASLAMAMYNHIRRTR